MYQEREALKIIQLSQSQLQHHHYYAKQEQEQERMYLCRSTSVGRYFQRRTREKEKQECVLQQCNLEEVGRACFLLKGNSSQIGVSHCTALITQLYTVLHYTSWVYDDRALHVDTKHA